MPTDKLRRHVPALLRTGLRPPAMRLLLHALALQFMLRILVHRPEQGAPDGHRAEHKNHMAGGGPALRTLGCG
ncbi:hypothetical protein [Acidovorax sp.]|uniref:hypothetical protein n=1 Tax=Acidovorax sp. TaxID=1872122 RepID=UPI00391F63CE